MTCCIHCDAFHPSVAEAIKAGWTSLQHDPADGWDYLGICPHCKRDQVEQERLAKQEPTEDLASTGREMGLTPQQIEQAKAEGVTTALGLRRIEVNSQPVKVPETIACARCDASSPQSLAAALQEGWTGLCRDDGPGWNYLEICRNCQAQEDESPAPEVEKKPEPQKRLFA